MNLDMRFEALEEEKRSRKMSREYEKNAQNTLILDLFNL